MSDIGRPIKFDPDLYCNVVEQMIESDEIERALHMLDNMPSYYRENTFKRAQDIKALLYKQIKTIKDYIEDPREVEDQDPEAEQFQSSFTYPRFDVIAEHIQKLNNESIVPHLVELGPASFWLPRLLKKAGLKFTYKPLTINHKSDERFLALNPEFVDSAVQNSGHTLFACFEVVEHMWNPLDIVHFYHKEGIDAQTVFLSTPLHTLLGGNPDKWSDKAWVEHLRAYTKQDFLEFAFKAFPGRSWTLIEAQMMVVVW